jgi:excisionase family DNA binding protein
VLPETERWMIVSEVAEYLRLSRAKIYEMAQQGEIPCAKLTGRWRFKNEQIDAWMANQTPAERRTAGREEDDS